MASKKTTIIKFDQLGGMQVEATGFVGSQCADTTAKILAGLGAETKKEDRKREYNMTAPASATGSVTAKRW